MQLSSRLSSSTGALKSAWSPPGCGTTAHQPPGCTATARLRWKPPRRAQVLVQGRYWLGLDGEWLGVGNLAIPPASIARTEMKYCPSSSPFQRSCPLANVPERSTCVSSASRATMAWYALAPRLAGTFSASSQGHAPRPEARSDRARAAQASRLPTVPSACTASPWPGWDCCRSVVRAGGCPPCVIAPPRPLQYGGRGVARLAQGHAKPGTAHAGHGAGAHFKAARGIGAGAQRWTDTAALNLHHRLHRPCPAAPAQLAQLDI